MVIRILQTLDPVLLLLFWAHDLVSNMLAKHFFLIKKIVLLVAHLSLLGILFPLIWRDYGKLAGDLLIFILFLSPASKITRMRILNQLMGMRREMGILFGYLALVHGLGYATDPAWRDIIYPLLPLHEILGVSAVYFYGFVALTLTFPLLLTSNNFMQSRLGQTRWKLLHRIVYLMFIFVVLHRFFQRGDPFSLLEAWFLLGVYLFVKLLAWRPFWPALTAWVAYVGNRYREYSLQKTSAV